jgi:hypothetical protein
MQPTAITMIVVLAAACGDDQEPQMAADLLERVRADEYRTWERAPGYETRRPTNAPHADSVDIYINANVAQALVTDETTEWPLGSLIVKDGFDDGDLELVAIMEKRPDGWFWAEYYDGVSVYSGKPGICIDCHDRGDDFVLAFDFPR